MGRNGHLCRNSTTAEPIFHGLLNVNISRCILYKMKQSGFRSSNFVFPVAEKISYSNLTRCSLLIEHKNRQKSEKVHMCRRFLSALVRTALALQVVVSPVRLPLSGLVIGVAKNIPFPFFFFFFKKSILSHKYIKNKKKKEEEKKTCPVQGYKKKGKGGKKKKKKKEFLI